ncbi:hypothetical protein AMTRI_Chr12g235820 [Amborella trichopoda]
MRCCAYILNIIVQAGLKVIHSSIKIVLEILRVPSKKGLVLNVPTRWNSTFDMLQSALAYKEVFARYTNSHHYDNPTSFLKVFKETINLFSGSKYPAAHIYFSEVWGIQDMLMEAANSQDETITSIIL